MTQKSLRGFSARLLCSVYMIYEVALWQILLRFLKGGIASTPKSPSCGASDCRERDYGVRITLVKLSCVWWEKCYGQCMKFKGIAVTMVISFALNGGRSSRFLRNNGCQLRYWSCHKSQDYNTGKPCNPFFGIFTEKRCYYYDNLQTRVQYDKCVSPFWSDAVVSILHVLSNLYVNHANSLDYMKYLYLWLI